MAKRRKKKKTVGFRTKLRRFVGTLLTLCVLTAVILDVTGVVTIDDIKVKVGIADKPAESSDTQVHFVDVGQGDCTLVVSDGEVMVIDSGDKDEDDTAVNYLKKQGVTEIKYLLVTHPHSDHIGEMADILENFTVDTFIMPKVADSVVPTTKVYENMLLAVKNQGLKITQATNSELTLGSCTVKLFTPKNTDYDNLNDFSTIVKIIHGDNSFLITGDCEKEEEKDILSQGFDLSAKVLKAGHHGSSTSSSADFLNEILPRYAVISCGVDNKYGHPHEETVTRLKKYADSIFVTSQCGTVVFSSDGEGLTVTTEKGD